MRTATYQQYVDRMSALTGVSSPSTEEAALWLTYFNRHIRVSWEAYQWPALCPTEEVTPEDDGTIDFENSAQEEIGEVFVVYSTNPASTSYPTEVPFELTRDGLQLVTPTVPTSVYVYYRIRCPEFDGTETDIPYDLLEPTVMWCYADQLFADGQHAKGIAMQAQGEAFILNGIERYQRQQRHRFTYPVFNTHSSRQSR